MSYAPSNVLYKGHNVSRLNLLDCVHMAISTIKNRISNPDTLKSELPQKNIDNPIRSILTPKQIQVSDDNNEELIPWPKIEGSLPIQMPNSVSPRHFDQLDGKNGYQPAIIEYKKKTRRERESRKSESEAASPTSQTNELGTGLQMSQKTKTGHIVSPLQNKEPETIILQIPDSFDDGKEMNSSSESSQSIKSRVQRSEHHEDEKISRKKTLLQRLKTYDNENMFDTAIAKPMRPKSGKRSERRLEYVKYLFLDK